MIKRIVEQYLLRLAKQYPVITMTGPRQSGKTTLCRAAFPHKRYISLENLDSRRMAVKDPRRFLADLTEGAVLDEIQRAPGLLSYIQGIVDERKEEGMFILAGSQQFELMDSITQSLAGRTALLKLLPFSYAEVYGAGRKKPDLNTVLFTGFYPRIFDKRLNPTEALAFYATTYIERDVRSLIRVQDLSRFETFLKICASQTGQILNLSHLSNECGIAVNTVKSWLSVLEASYIIFLLKPHHKNFRKRLIRSPKLYFVDVGLAAFLLDIQDAGHLKNHPLRGALFETFIVTEMLKERFNHVQTNNMYYFRDNVGNEVDVLMDMGSEVIPVEIKSGQTVADEFFKGLNYYRKLNPAVKQSWLVYGGDKLYREGGHHACPYDKIAEQFGG
ncbi:MAG: AAA family ATPase [Omnitrophica WOR_2 bacterium RIFCSPHIGHO2_02_FULL_50_17]|nr:MAG: AAA family ATPase [Omnitrophica WOR_2 bacterium RIFCSPHIGHO2_02_FULL_50_17]